MFGHNQGERLCLLRMHPIFRIFAKKRCHGIRLSKLEQEYLGLNKFPQLLLTANVFILNVKFKRIDF